MIVILLDNLLYSLEEFSTTKMHCQYLGVMKQKAGYLNFMKSHTFFFDISVVAIKGGNKDKLVLSTPTAKIQSEMPQVTCRTR